MSFGAPSPAHVEDAALLIRINQLYDRDMSPQALYEATRGVWVLGARRERARYALAVFQQVVLEAYAIEHWHPAGTTSYTTRVIDRTRYGNRWEFTGRLAEQAVRARYVGRSVASYFERGAANPVMYVNC